MLSATYRVSNDNPRSFPAALPTKQARRRDHPNGKIQAPRAQPLAPSSCFAVQLPRSPSRVQRRPASARGPFPFARQLPPNHPNLLRSTLSTGGTLFHLPRPSAPHADKRVLRFLITMQSREDDRPLHSNLRCALT